MDKLEKKRQEAIILRDLIAAEERLREVKSPRGQVKKVLGQAVGVGETALSMATGAGSQIPAGVLGTIDLLSDGLGEGAKTARNVQEELTYSPRTEEGQRFVGTLSAGMGELEKKLDYGLENYVAPGSPAAQTAWKTTILGVPQFLGLGKGVPKRLSARQKILAEEKEINKMGVELDSAELPSQIVSAAKKEAVGTKGSGAKIVQDELLREKKILLDRKNQLYDEAGKGNASIKRYEAAAMDIDARIELIDKNNYDIASMPVVQKRLADLEDISARSFRGEDIPINELYNLKKRINQNRPAKTDKQQNSALSVMNKKIDDFIDDKLFNDLVKGDKANIQQWKDALKSNKEYQSKFYGKEASDKIITKIVSNELAPEEVKNLILGVSKLKGNSAVIIKKIKNILGDKHPSMDQLRMEILLPVIEPLFEAKPNFAKFSKNVDELTLNHSSVVKELSPHSMKPLMKLKKLTDAAIKKEAAPEFDINMTKTGITYLFGHGLHRAAARMSIINKIVERMKGVGKHERLMMLREMTGVDPRQPFISKKSMFGSALLGSQLEGQQYDPSNDPVPSIPDGSGKLTGKPTSGNPIRQR